MLQPTPAPHSLRLPTLQGSLPKQVLVALLIGLQIAPLGVLSQYTQSTAYAQSAPGPGFAAAPIVAAPPSASNAGLRPSVVVSGNGVPVINIVPPSAGGVSNNQFSQFNVGTPGVIFNNSGANSPTQLGGWVAGNPMLGNHSATTILGQVTGHLPSHLNGYMEVGGNKANLVIANPNGITCAGCGFINVPNATLTTGQVQLGASGIAGINTATASSTAPGQGSLAGQIVVNGQGLDASGVNQLDILSRSAQINASIWVGNNASNNAANATSPNTAILNVVLGENQITTNGQGAGTAQGTPQVSSTAASTAPPSGPAVALDVSQLGGMYAGAIRLIGTQAGLGVNSAGNIQAASGDLQLSANGQISLSASAQTQAAGNTAITTATATSFFGSPALNLSRSVNQAIFTDAFNAFGSNLLFSPPLTGSVANQFDRSMVNREQNAAQPFYNQLPAGTSPWLLQFGAHNIFVNYTTCIFSGPCAPTAPSNTSINNLQDRIDFGNSLVDFYQRNRPPTPIPQPQAPSNNTTRR